MHCAKWLTLSIGATILWVASAQADNLIRLSLPSSVPDAPIRDLRLDTQDVETLPVFGYRGFYGPRFYGGYRWGGFYGYRGFYGGFPIYRGFYYPRTYFYPNYFAYRSFYPGFGWGFPSYYSYSYSYSPFFCPIGGSVALAPTPVQPLQIIPKAQPVPPSIETAPIPMPQPQPVNPSAGTFPYDGGPRVPVPMPTPDPQPQNRVPAAPKIEDGIPVSLPGQPKKVVYPAFGEHPKPKVVAVKGN